MQPFFIKSVMNMIRHEAPIRGTIAANSLIGVIANDEDEFPGNLE
jgi:hypothetical protein